MLFLLRWSLQVQLQLYHSQSPRFPCPAERARDAGQKDRGSDANSNECSKNYTTREESSLFHLSSTQNYSLYKCFGFALLRFVILAIKNIVLLSQPIRIKTKIANRGLLARVFPRLAAARLRVIASGLI